MPGCTASSAVARTRRHVAGRAPGGSILRRAAALRGCVLFPLHPVSRFRVFLEGLDPRKGPTHSSRCCSNCEGAERRPASRLPPRAHDVSCSRRAPRSTLAWCPTLALVLRAPCPVASVALVRRRAREPALPRPFGCFRFPCGGPLLSILRPLSKQLQVEAPDAGGAPAVALDGLFSGVSLCVSLTTPTCGYLPAASCSFLSQCPLGCLHIRYKCMMIQVHDVTWQLTSCNARLHLASSCANLCQLHHLNRELS